VSDLRQLFDDLVRLETELWDAVDERLRTVTVLPLTWFEPMSVIDRMEGCRVHDIAHALGITVGGTSKLVDRIEAAGLCHRRPNPDDRRSTLIALTPAGEARLIAAGSEFDAVLAQWFALPEETLEPFAAALRQLRTTGPAAGEGRRGE
jgi:DNA-binding MarR family transcriptional regulator